MEDIKRIKDQIVKSRDFHKTLTKFIGIQSIHAKVNYAVQVLNNFRHLSRLERENTLREAKDERRAADFLNKAHESVKNKGECKVMMMGHLNKCLGFAPRSSENITQAYIERAMILLNWRHYDDCLDNLRMAQDTPHGRRHRSAELERIEKDCRTRMLAPQSSLGVAQESKLSFAPNSRVPFIAEHLDITTNLPDVRVYTRENLPIGSIVSVEEPFCFYISERMQRYKCANCAKDLDTLIPCAHCTRTLFCSLACQEEGNRVFHRFECGFINFLLDNIDDFHMIALRITLVAMSLFPNVKEMIKFYRNEVNQNQNSFTIDYQSPNRKLEEFRAIMNWEVSRDKHAPVDVFQVALIAGIFKHFLLEHSPMKNMLTTAQEKNFLGELLFHHIQSCPHNCEGILHSMDLKNGDRALEILGIGAYPFLSMLHTGDPNISRTFEGAKCVLSVCMETMKHETLIQPFSHHQLWEHTKLHTAYDTKLFDDLEFIDVPEKLCLKDVRLLLAGDRQFAEDHIEVYSDYLNKYANFYPCYQTNLVEHCLYMAFGLLADAMPIETYVRNMLTDSNP